MRPPSSPPGRGLAAHDRDRTVAPGALAIGMVVAPAAITATFRGPRRRFWARMTATGLGLGLFALAASLPARRARPGPRQAALGLLTAVPLYLAFRTGDGLVRRYVPGGAARIRELYGLRSLRPGAEIALRLAVVGPAEELFWRGLVQDALAARLGHWPGAAAAAAAYGGAHLGTGNLTLVGAAGVAGAYWGLLYAAGVPLGALMVSHLAWDLWIFLVAPTDGAAPPGPAAPAMA